MPSFVSLAEELLDQAKKLDNILEQNHIPYPSFGEDTLESLPEDAQQTRWDLLDTSHNIRQLVRGARRSGFDISFAWIEEVVLRLICRYNLASAVPLDGSATYEEIAASSGLDASLVIRTTRVAITLNIFDEAEPGRVCHTAISRLLATDEGYCSVLGLHLEDIGPASLKLIESWSKYGQNAGEADDSAFALNNGGRSLFTVLAEEPDRARRFDLAMKAVVEEKSFSLSHIVKAFDWATLDKPGSWLVDLGGGYGQISQALAKHTHNLHITIQDLPHVVEQGQKKMPIEFAERITFEAHSFMEPQPKTERPPDAFLISRCLHNWNDYNCAKILRALIPVLHTTSKIFIWDSVLSDSPVKKLSESFNLHQDFIMATLINGKDRSAEEFRQMLELSDPRFVIESISQPPGSALGLIEVSWKG